MRTGQWVFGRDGKLGIVARDTAIDRAKRMRTVVYVDEMDCIERPGSGPCGLHDLYQRLEAVADLRAVLDREAIPPRRLATMDPDWRPVP